MFTLRLNKGLKKIFLSILFFILIIFVLRKLYIHQNQKYTERMYLQNLAKCNVSDTINFRHKGNFRIYFNGKYQEKSLENVIVKQIRDGKFMLQLKNIDIDKETISNILIKDTLQLLKEDSIVIILENKDSIFLSGFKNEPYYVGQMFGNKRFLGCYFAKCINGKDTLTVLNGILYLDN
ncbi:hypothetical protein CCAN12_790158 [Capnocytophaga canimorsus]|uniref:Uncharacterized protein n=1 Tax=Capnocytophaga canimorsus TaxID=28188 RepID=A0A0B7HQI4_9FLAO|nr:hypothetical protein [Capnocytophaga canimorsus]ATA76779.1 hypothetical protein CGC47_03865 [Capnocytophaga canimorsus]PJI84102.1 hypothetical protein CLV61_0719 [Capnocytophaga canimorsus]CEN40889.1 hypothetical protein CCAN12_790158 [Capnocytophaga canimorsus]STA71971.1 Uncharacterised protein [Capnocytophaga canimorsus]